MRPNPALQRLRGGETVLGMFAIDLYSTGLARTATSAGAEFVVFDQEHTGWGLDQIRPLLAAARASATVPLVRVRTLDAHAIGSVLALGALGVMVPLIRDADEARAVVAAAKYPPQGDRGYGILYPDEHEGDVGGYMRWANDELMVIAMVETVSALDDLDNIAAIDGIDVLWIGHFDLTASMGIPGEFDHPRYAAALPRRRGLRGHGKAAGISTDEPTTRAALARPRLPLHGLRPRHRPVARRAPAATRRRPCPSPRRPPGACPSSRSQRQAGTAARRLLAGDPRRRLHLRQRMRPDRRADRAGPRETVEEQTESCSTTSPRSSRPAARR